MNKFKPRTLIETLDLLCQAKGGALLYRGKPNGSEIGRLAGTSQVNVSRWFSYLAKPTDENIKKLAKAFKISPAQMRGEMPIEGLDQFISNSEPQDSFIRDFSSLDEKGQEIIREHVRYLKHLQKEQQST